MFGRTAEKRDIVEKFTRVIISHMQRRLAGMRSLRGFMLSLAFGAL